MSTTTSVSPDLLITLDSTLSPAKTPSALIADYNRNHPMINRGGIWIDNPAPKTRIPTILDRKANVQDLKELFKLNEKGNSLVRNDMRGNVFHANYLGYLEECWGYHWTPVLTPDVIWFTLLNEIASIVRDNVEPLRDLFTVRPDKTEITIETDDVVMIPLRRLVVVLTEYVPTSVDAFLPTFTTTDDPARLAFCAAFCDIVSPYYNYSMFCCGLPAILVRGTEEDWTKLFDSWLALPIKLRSVAATYHSQVLSVLGQIMTARITQDTEFWKGIFTSKRCGSGSDTEIDGWFTRFFRKQPKGMRRASHFATHAARVNYTNLSTDKHYSMLTGLFSSQLGEDGVATPLFDSLVFETPSRVES